MRAFEPPAHRSGEAVWYLVAEDGDLVLRIHAGMSLGEDPAGDLVVDPSTPMVVLDLDAAGGVNVAVASPEVELETPAGARDRSFDVLPGTRAMIALPHNTLILDSDFAGQPGTVVLELACVAAGAFKPPPARPVPDPATELAKEIRARTQRPPPQLPTVRRRFLKVAVAASILIGLVALPYWSHDVGYLAQWSEVLLAFRPAETATSPSTGRAADAERDAPATPDDDAEPAEMQKPDGGVRFAAPAAGHIAEFTVTAARHDLAAASSAVRPALAPVTVPDTVRRTAPEAAAPETPVLPGLEPPPAPAPVSVASPDSTLPGYVPRTVKLTNPAVDVAATVSSSTVFRVGTEAGEAPSEGSVGLPIRQNLTAAALALREGRLATPEGRSALDHYRRVLEADPDSVDAATGIRSVREALLIRARAALDAEDLGTAETSIQGAGKAGANAEVVAALSGELAYRRTLLNAKLGRPGSLYPLSELEAKSQVLPTYPRVAPAYATGSVDLELTVTERGTVQDLTVIAPAAAYFNAAARKAIARWHFEPVLHDDRPVAVRTAVRITFLP